MAAVAIQIRGTLYDLLSRTSRQVLLQGEASLLGLGIGGGPIIPDGGGEGIWGPGDPRPQPPIQLPPGWESGNPPGIWGGGNVPMPSPPIANVPGLPPMPDQPPEGPPDDNGFIKPPPDGGWGYHQTYGWLFNPAETQAGPKS